MCKTGLMDWSNQMYFFNFKSATVYMHEKRYGGKEV